MSNGVFRPTLGEVRAVEQALSAARVGRYVANGGLGNLRAGLALYGWNAAVSGAFMMPLHVCEVTARNGAVLAIERVYGVNWPWSTSFLRSLPNPRQGFNPQAELQRASRGMTQPGKVIAELKFAFWNDMFTSRHDARLWRPWIRTGFPNLPSTLSEEDCRKLMFQQLGKIRKLRNRIAHHEPIFDRPLSAEYQRVLKVISWRCNDTAKWLDHAQTLTALIHQRP